MKYKEINSVPVIELEDLQEKFGIPENFEAPFVSEAEARKAAQSYIDEKGFFSGVIVRGNLTSYALVF